MGGMWYGWLHLGGWSCVWLTFVMVQATIMSVTLYLHRSQAHRACVFHPVLAHLFRFWVWLTTSMRTDQWVAVHRYHHARVETAEDPHSPWTHGIWNVLFRGVWIYHQAASNTAMVEKYSHGTPKDWLETRVYRPYQRLGIKLLLCVELGLFGGMGLIMWVVQMLWIPFHAAGVINGLGHYVGYRNFETQDRSTNLIPFAVWIGGEELHNNHHAFPDSAKFSLKPYELDIGFLLLKVLAWCRLATIKRLAPELSDQAIAKSVSSLDKWKLLVANRLRVLQRYCEKVLVPQVQQHKVSGGVFAKRSAQQALEMMTRSKRLLSQQEHERLHVLLAASKNLLEIRTLYEKLEDICHQTKVGQVEMQKALQAWCIEAKKTGVEALQRYGQWIEDVFCEQTGALSS